jgi:hypothetical protein
LVDEPVLEPPELGGDEVVEVELAGTKLLTLLLGEGTTVGWVEATGAGLLGAGVEACGVVAGAGFDWEVVAVVVVLCATFGVEMITCGLELLTVR